MQAGWLTGELTDGICTVMVSFFLYAILAFLLATERGTSTCFHIASFWSMIFTDMSIVLYKEWREIFRRNIDMCLHAVNAVILLYSMLNMPYAPTTFVLMSLGGWYVSFACKLH